MLTYKMTDTLRPRETRIRNEKGKARAPLMASASGTWFHGAITDCISAAGDRLPFVGVHGCQCCAVDPSDAVL